MPNSANWSWQEVKDFWNGDNLRNIIPLTGDDFPEGFDVYKTLQFIQHFCGAERIVELGCGYGRLAPAFLHQTYQGLDINSQAIDAAKERCPNHHFSVVNDPEGIPPADLILAYTVLLHIPDATLPMWADEIGKKADWIVVAEILGNEWRKTNGNIPVFNRERDQLEAAFSSHKLLMEIRQPYRRYAENPQFSHRSNTDMSFLVFGAK